ncbi:hypothetical protein AQUCO_03300071v1 [Aquilegia coerulea]|uniref:Uncharacterized protein n=1 Tax=Aquilegia coerulea TaxID=218851 RepID=A0A2G5CZB2_AQUCA|nr:hypothetical protein AQUCO_03300071v1 [Aquilegia coerulea]
MDDWQVPFGKAAFFPGRLIHTNEFLVLLGEGYYAERTSKQTVDILHRRGKVLDSQVDSLNAVMMDLKAEASFFDSTATEAAEGLVEIREDYIEELPSERMSDLRDSSQLDLLGVPEEAEANLNDDEEYARIMARFDELEREELAAEGVLENDDDEGTIPEIGSSRSQDNLDMVSKISADLQPKDPLGRSEERSLHNTTANKAQPGDQLPHSYYGDSIASGATPNASAHSEKVPVKKASEPSSSTRTSSSTAFTGSIVEHTHGLPTIPLGKSSTSSQSTESAPSKPLSRFKMQKGGR